MEKELIVTYEIWISPAVGVDYFYVQSCDTRSEADTIQESWSQAGYLTIVHNHGRLN